MGRRERSLRVDGYRPPANWPGQPCSWGCGIVQKSERRGQRCTARKILAQQPQGIAATSPRCAGSSSPALLVLIAAPAGAVERWQTLPPTPAPILTYRSGMAEANGIKIHYAIYGSGSPVIFLHGGLANSDYWGNQVPTVAAPT